MAAHGVGAVLFLLLFFIAWEGTSAAEVQTRDFACCDEDSCYSDNYWISWRQCGSGRQTCCRKLTTRGVVSIVAIVSFGFVCCLVVPVTCCVYCCVRIVRRPSTRLIVHHHINKAPTEEVHDQPDYEYVPISQTSQT